MAFFFALACVLGVSNGVIERKLKGEQKKLIEVIPILCRSPRSQLSRQTRAETLATQAIIA